MNIDCLIRERADTKRKIALLQEKVDRLTVLINEEIDNNQFKMFYGEYEDLENYIFDEKNLHKAMAVLYRPIKFKKKDRYLIHDYEGTEFMAEVMKNTPLDIVFGARVFFYSLAKKLGIYTLDYTLQQLMKSQENQSDKHLDKNGEDTKRFIHSQMEMLKELTKLQDFHFTNV